MKLELSRKQKIAITAWAVAVAAVVIFSLSREQAVGKGGAGKFKRLISHPETVVTQARRELPRRAPRPRLRAREGWPFEQLPMVAKFEPPVPHVVAVAITPPGYIRVVPPLAPAVVLTEPQPEDPPLWLVPVGAGGIGFGGGSTTYDSGVVPEPTTLLLLSGGLALIGLKRRRRKEN